VYLYPVLFSFCHGRREYYLEPLAGMCTGSERVLHEVYRTMRHHFWCSSVMVGLLLHGEALCNINIDNWLLQS